MGSAKDLERRHGYSRRSVLGKLGLGLTAIAGAALLLRSRIPMGDDGDHTAALPGPDSIFHPRSDPGMEGPKSSEKT